MKPAVYDSVENLLKCFYMATQIVQLLLQAKYLFLILYQNLTKSVG